MKECSGKEVVQVLPVVDPEPEQQDNSKLLLLLILLAIGGGGIFKNCANGLFNNFLSRLLNPSPKAA